MTDTTQPPAETLAPCPLCGRPPKRNGRGGTGVVLCAGDNVTVGMIHRFQTYGADQAEADAAWNAAALTRRAGGDAIGQSDGDPDGWLAVKVNGEGGIVMPYGPLHAGPDRPNDSRYRWAPFYIGDTK